VEWPKQQTKAEKKNMTPADLEIVFSFFCCVQWKTPIAHRIQLDISGDQLLASLRSSRSLF